MMKKSYMLSFFLLFIAKLGVMGQTRLKDNLVEDSTVLKYRIKQVIQNWYTSESTNQSPSQSTTEIFNTGGKITKRIYISYTYHKFVSCFSYNEKKDRIIVKEKYYDWSNNKNKNKTDTIIKTSTNKYKLDSKLNVSVKENKFNTFQIILKRDSIGRVIQARDTIKCGCKIFNYHYNDNGDIIEIRHLFTRDEELPQLYAIERFTYNTKGQKEKVVNYYDFKNIEGIEKHNREVITEYKYNSMGLLKEELVETKHLNLKESYANPSKSLYAYEYLFY